MNFRTDLAIEIKDDLGKNDIKGVNSNEQKFENFTISMIEILDSDGERVMNKPCGTYITAHSERFFSNESATEEEILVISEHLRKMMPTSEKPVLVVGLGNNDITPDALGPQSAARIIATRHIEKSQAEEIGMAGMRSVAVISPGVMGQTGIESGEIILSVKNQIDPSCVIIIDALASKSTDRLGKTIQIADSGISPGSGVQNHRKQIDREMLGIPVISIGVPTVVDATTLVADLTGTDLVGEQRKRTDSFMVAPREIDLLIKRSVEMVSLIINKSLQPFMELDEISMLTS